MNKNIKIALIAIAGSFLIVSSGFNIGILSKTKELNDKIANKEQSKTENNNKYESKEKYLTLLSDSVGNSLLCSKSYAKARDLELSYVCESNTKDHEDYTYIKEGETEEATETIISENSIIVDNKITIKKESDYVSFEFYNKTHYVEDHYSVVNKALVYEKEEGEVTTTIKFIKNGEDYQQQCVIKNTHLTNDLQDTNSTTRKSYNFSSKDEYATNVSSALLTLFETVVEYEMLSVLIMGMYADPVYSFSEDGSGTITAVLTMPEPTGSLGFIRTTYLDYSQKTNGKEFNTDFVYCETSKDHVLNQISHDSLKLTTQSISYEPDVSTFDDQNSLYDEFDNWDDLCVCIGQ